MESCETGERFELADEALRPAPFPSSLSEAGFLSKACVGTSELPSVVPHDGQELRPSGMALSQAAHFIIGGGLYHLQKSLIGKSRGQSNLILSHTTGPHWFARLMKMSS